MSGVLVRVLGCLVYLWGVWGVSVVDVHGCCVCPFLMHVMLSTLPLWQLHAITL